jgi:hypothetical protein
MNMKPLRILSGTVFFLGVIIGFGLAVITIWNSLEAARYYFTGAKYEPFDGLRCPVMIAPTEKGIVTAVFNNSTDQEDNFLYRAEISGDISKRHVEGQILVPPHQRKSIQLTVDANDVDLTFFIFVKMRILPNALHRSQESVCGIMIVNLLKLTGTQLSAAAFSLSFLGIAIGLVLMQKTGTNADENIRRPMQALGLVVLLTMFAGLMGWWIAGMALAVIIALLIVISIHHAIA